MAQTGTATITLVNRSRRTKVFNLPYRIAGLRYCIRQLVGRVVYDGSTGAKRVKGDNKRLSDSLTLMGKGQEGDTIPQLPPAVRNCPEVASAIEARDVRCIELDAEQSAQQATELRESAVKKAEAKGRMAIFLKNKAEQKAKIALARAVAMAPKPPGPTEEELEAKKAEQKRLADEKAAADAAAAAAKAEAAKKADTGKGRNK